MERKAVIDVGCAIIVREKKILIAQRKREVQMGGFWEFPGGKCEENETLFDCLVREVAEELGVDIKPREIMCKSMHEDPHRTLKLFFVVCDWVSGEARAIDCAEFRWALAEELPQFQFPPADAELVSDIVSNPGKYFL